MYLSEYIHNNEHIYRKVVVGMVITSDIGGDKASLTEEGALNSHDHCRIVACSPASLAVRGTESQRGVKTNATVIPVDAKTWQSRTGRQVTSAVFELVENG